jgi:hypothetical protein
MAETSHHRLSRIRCHQKGDCLHSLLYCSPTQNLDGHLQRSLHWLNHEVQRTTVARFVSLPVAQVFEDLAPWEDGSKPLSYLGPPILGFCCPHCSASKTKIWYQMRGHGKSKHGLTAPECKRDRSRYACFLQSWTTYPPKYWVANRDDDSEQEAPLQHLHLVTEQKNVLRLEANPKS